MLFWIQNHVTELHKLSFGSNKTLQLCKGLIFFSFLWMVMKQVWPRTLLQGVYRRNLCELTPKERKILRLHYPFSAKWIGTFGLSSPISTVTKATPILAF